MMRTAAIVAVLGGALAVAWLWRPHGSRSPAVRALLALYGVLGAWALWFGVLAPGAREPELVQLCKPTVVYWALATLLVVGPLRGWDYPAKWVVGTYFTFSAREWRYINVALAAFLLALGGLNLYVAFTGSRDEWEGYKWSCMANVAAILLLRVTFLWIDSAVRLARYLYGRVRAGQP